MTFSSLGLSEILLKELENQNFTVPFPVQAEAIPAILKGKDVFCNAPTGSGKTASFVLPILELLQNNKPSRNRHIKVLVLVPTRELAIQTDDVFRQFAASLPRKVKSLAVFGGVSINPQMIQLQGVEILIATPGRLLDLVTSNALSLSSVETLILDEADKMLNLGFKQEMDSILKLLASKRQNILYSATLAKEVTSIKDILLNNPVEIVIQENANDLLLIEELAYFVPEEKKGPLLRYLIRREGMDQVLVFVSSIFKADSVVNKLQKNGIQAASFHSKNSQGARMDALRKFKSGALRVLVATDLASRGIDIQLLPYVINYELPRSPKEYIHRIGRTGRAGSQGMAISLISPEERQHFKVIQKKSGKPVTMIDSEGIDLHGY